MLCTNLATSEALHMTAYCHTYNCFIFTNPTCLVAIATPTDVVAAPKPIRVLLHDNKWIPEEVVIDNLNVVYLFPLQWDSTPHMLCKGRQNTIVTTHALNTFKCR